MILALAVVMTLAGTLTSEATGSKLADIGEAPWARQAIAEMNASEIISGYPSGVFKPYESATRLQVVAMLIRVLGLEEQAQALATTDVNYKMPADLPAWGRGYLIMGVQRGMLDKDHLDQLGPNAPATRAQVAALTSLALKLSLGGSALTFTDNDQIPQDYRDYVSAVVKNKIMQGLPGNVFKPNDEINRAQMAVLLSRLVENNFAGDEIKSHRLSGTLSTLSSVDSSRWLLSLNSGTNKILTSDSEVFLDGKSAGPADLKAGDTVKLVLAKNDQVIFVNAARGNTSPVPNSPSTAYRGKVDSLLQVGGDYWLGLTALDGTQLTRPVLSSVKVLDQGSEKEVSSLGKGDYVEIKVADNKIIAISSLATSTLTGTVTTVRSSGLSVRSDAGDITDLEVTGDVIVTKNDSVRTFSDIKEGNRVEVSILDNKVLRITILSAPTLEGTIREIITIGTSLITISGGNGDIHDYVVEGDAEVIQNGSRLRFDDLRVGDQIRLELNSRNRISYIEMTGNSSNKLTGEVREVDTTGTWGITLRDDDGNIRDYVVDNNVETKRNGSYLRFEALNIGDYVKLELNSRDQVNYVETVERNSSTFSGTIADLAINGSPWLKINKSDGTNSRYSIADTYDFNKNGSSLRLRDIVIGSEVQVQVAGGKVSRLSVTNDSDIKIVGEVTTINTDIKKIFIQQISGNEFSYYLTDSAILKDDIGRSISLGDVSVGWNVELVLSGGQVSRLTRQAD